MQIRHDYEVFELEICVSMATLKRLRKFKIFAAFFDHFIKLFLIALQGINNLLEFIEEYCIKTKLTL